MDNKYKVIVAGKEIYEEIELEPTAKTVRFGTVMGCDIRVHKDLFFEEFWLSFQNTGECWKINCSDNVYLYIGDIRKLTNKILENGETLYVRYQESNASLFSLEFVMDFSNENKQYQRAVDIKSVAGLRIGTENTNQIILGSKFANNESVCLNKTNRGLELQPVKTSYGVYHNGAKVLHTAIVQNTDFFSLADYTFYFKDGMLWTEKRDDLQINGLSYYDLLDLPNYPLFVRNTREKIVVDSEKIEILDPPAKPEKPKNNIIMSLLPSMGMIMTSGLMAAMGGTMVVYSLVSGGMAVVLAVATVIQGNRNYKKEVKERIEKYHSYEQRKRQEIEGYRNKEREELNRIFLDIKGEEQLLNMFSGELFDRMPEDEDFLDVRFGTGNINAIKKVEYKKQEKLEIEDDLQQIPEKMEEEYKMLQNAPVICHLKTANAIGIIGKEKYRYEIMKSMVFDICIRQYASDVYLFFVCEPEHADKISIFRFLPHVNQSDVGFRGIACDYESKNRVFDFLYKTLSQREKDKPAQHIIVFFYDKCEFNTHPVSKFLQNAKDVNTTFVFMEDQKSDIPTGCKQHIYVDENARMVDTEDINNTVEFSYQTVDASVVAKMVRMLAPVHTEEISLESSLTKNITLFEMLGILSVEDLDLSHRWNSSKVYQSMAAPIGVTRNGLIYLDLHDKAHGPHGLVAGTTGSGKSELLQTYILSVATYYHPYEVGFVIIDFKGGGMANQFKELPHLLGAITNIDGKEINRSLRFIKAELQKRQRLFAEAGVNHIDKYIKKYKSGEVDIPLPHLILIVDEFAELKAEQPEFMQELISAARIGRSLGVHLILATQKPAGQVDDQIWSNSRFKLCLKVQDQQDSNEVLKSPLAAEIKEPGRAYLQVGNNEIFELFQSAYSGAPERVEGGAVKEFSIYEVLPSGRKKEVYSQKRKKSGESKKSQLEAVVEYIHTYFKNSGQSLPQGICLPPLPESVFYAETAPRNGMFDIGIYDDPDQQLQSNTFIDFDNRNTLILGAAQHGKTNLLMSVIRSAAAHRTPKQQVFYILDFNSMILKNFEELNHVGGVVSASEDEKLKNLMKLLFEEIAVRKEKMLDAGVGSFAAYLEAGYTDLPRIYLIIDNFTAAMELYFNDNDNLLNIVRDGLAAGISTIITNSQTSGIGYRYLSNFANKIVFHCNDSSEYINVFDHVDTQPDDVAGRCIVEMDKRILECQTYLAFQGTKEIERVQQMQQLIFMLNNKNKGMEAKTIPYIPSVLTVDLLEKKFNTAAEGYNLPIGLTYKEVVPFILNIAQLGLIGLCGKGNSGQNNFLKYLFGALEKMNKQYPVRAVIFDDVSRGLGYLQDSPLVDTYTLDTEKVSSILQEWHSILKTRYESLLDTGMLEENNELLLMIVQNNDVAKRIGEDIDLSDKFNEIVSRYKAMNVALIFSNYQNVSLPFDAPEPLRQIKKDQHIFFFDDLDNLKVFDVPYDAIKENRKRLESGDAYYIKDNEVTKIKMIKTDE